jgi:hypothetical protein
VEKPARRGRKAADPVSYPLFHECVTFPGKIKSGDMITKNGNKINHKNNNKNVDSKSENKKTKNRNINFDTKRSQKL